ncbi:MAG: hypothetical protein ACXVJK_03395, partial [Candidatus Aminicenantales bacterium]
MKRFVPLAVAVCFLLPAVLSPGQPDKVSIRFGPQSGAALTYSINGQVNVSGKDFFGKDLTLDADAQGEIRLSVMNSSNDSVLAGLTTPGIQVRAQLPDRTQTQTLKTLEGKSLKVSFNRTGKVMDIRNPEALAQENVLNF